MEDYIILGILIFVLFYLSMNINLHESFRIGKLLMSNYKTQKKKTKSRLSTKNLKKYTSQ